MQAAYDPVVAPGPSSLHSKLAPASPEENENDGVLSLVAPFGPESIDVSGAAVSIVKDLVGGLGATLPAPSFARTENVYEPSASGP